MVNICDYKKVVNQAGEEFFALVLQGELELIKSSETGNFYATARRATITSTFNEESCKALIGQKLPGKIVKMETESYDYTIPETGEVIKLSHSFKYLPDPVSMEEEVFEKELETA